MKNLKLFKNYIIVCVLAVVIFVCCTIPGGSIAAGSADTAEAESEGNSGVRTTQFNAFDVPVDTSGIDWQVFYNRHSDFHKISFGYTTAPAPRSDAQFAAILARAKACLGVQYTPAGKSPSTGFDCSGFVWYLLHDEFQQLSAASTAGQYEQCYHLQNEDAMPGDIAFFNDSGREGVITHVGLYIGDGKIIHASSTKGICIADLSDSYCSKCFIGFGRPYK